MPAMPAGSLARDDESVDLLCSTAVRHILLRMAGIEWG